MRKREIFISTLLFCLLYLNVKAQDAYHTNLQSTLQNTYGLPAGQWVLNNTEAANLNSDYWYGDVSGNNIAASGQDFSQKVNIVVNNSGSNPWDAGYGIKNIQQINSGDVGLLIMWLRSDTEDAKVSLFAENSSTFEKEVILTFDLVNQWTQFIIPFDANQTYAADGLTFGLHLAWSAQTIELGGVAMINYGSSVSLEDLPNLTNNHQYGGWGTDAPWRAEAADRIDQLRKADLTIRVEDTDGIPIPMADVEVEMLQHEYAFGSAVVSRLFAGNNSQNAIYEDKILNMDGNGHGFNWVVFENALKWPGWEQNWISTKPQTANAVQWLHDRDIKVRGHNIIWPGWSNLPDDIEDNQTNPDYIRDRINSHIETITSYPGIAGNIREWDVLNETTTNRDLEFALQGQPGYTTGREIYSEIFQKLAEADPNIKTYINDYVTLSLGNTGGGTYDLKKQFAQEIIDSGVRLDGIGFQAHIGGFPNSIYDVYNTLEDFYSSFGTTAKITEYDTNEAIDDELAATYLRDFMTIVFSHESTDGFLMWGFWDGAHWKSNAPLFYQDWTIKPAGEAFIDLVFNEWWTDDSGQTNSEGEFKVRGFKGKYKISIDCGDEILVDTIELKADMLIIKSEGDLVLDLESEIANPAFNIYPNPATEILFIEQHYTKEIEVRIFDSSGKVVFNKKSTNTNFNIPLDFGKGLFEIVLEAGDSKFAETILVH